MHTNSCVPGGTAVLPFKKGLKVAVVGPHGNATKEMVGNYLGQLCPGPAAGNFAVGTNPSGDGGFSCVDSPFTSIAKANTDGTTIFSQGCEIDAKTISTPHHQFLLRRSLTQGNQ